MLLRQFVANQCSIFLLSAHPKCVVGFAQDFTTCKKKKKKKKKSVYTLVLVLIIVTLSVDGWMLSIYIDGDPIVYVNDDGLIRM